MYWPFAIFLGHPGRAIQSPQPIGAPSWPCFNVSGVTAELSQSSALSMEEAVCYTDMCLAFGGWFPVKNPEKMGSWCWKSLQEFAGVFWRISTGVFESEFWRKTALDLYFFLGGGQLEQKNPWPTDIWPLRCCQEFPEVCRAAGGKIVDFLRVNLGIFKRHVSCSVICIYTLAKYNYRLYHMHKCRHILTYTYWDTLWYIVCNILIDSHGNGSYRLVTWAIFVFTPRNEYGT